MVWYMNIRHVMNVSSKMGLAAIVGLVPIVSFILIFVLFIIPLSSTQAQSGPNDQEDEDSAARAPCLTPSTPAGLSTSVSENRVQVTWNSVSNPAGTNPVLSGAIFYDVQYKVRSTTSWKLKSGLSGTSTTIGGLSPNSYEVQVRAEHFRDGNSCHGGWSPSSTFTIRVPPSIRIHGLGSTMEPGDTDSFTVSASNLVSSNSYTIRITTNHSSIGFNSTCSDRQEDVTVTSGSTSFSTSQTLRGCSTPGGTVTATLRQGTSTIATDTHTVTVRVPAPSISINGLGSTMESGDTLLFTVSASNLISSNSYTIRITTNRSSIGFNSTCSDRQEDVTVTSGSTSFSTSQTLRGCSTPGGTVTARLRQGTSTIATDTHNVTVRVPAPSININGLGSTMEPGDTDSFTVSASNLVSSNSYTIRITTNHSSIGFNSTCSDRQEDVTVTSGSTSFSTSQTLRGCSTPGGTVTATLRQGTSTIATDTHNVTVAVPVPDPSISINGLGSTMEPGDTDSFTVSASNLVSSNSYTIRIATNHSSIGSQLTTAASVSTAPAQTGRKM